MTKQAKSKQSQRMGGAWVITNCQLSIINSLCLLLFAFCFLISPLTAQDHINLNTASAEELMRLPYVGNTVAHRILEHRRKHGNFKRPQDLIIIKGLSAKRYRQIAHLIRI